MTAWLSRNAMPIGIVVVASAAVIGAFELIDLLTASAPVAGNEAETPAGVASIGGLIKVALFLGAGALVARSLRRRFRSDPPSSATP